jgi:hypothetical protein
VRRLGLLRSALPLSQRDPKSTATIQEVSEFTGLSTDTLGRRYRKKYRRLSLRRVGMSVADAIEIAEGRALDDD